VSWLQDVWVYFTTYFGSEVWPRLVEHAALAAAPVVAGLAVSLPIGFVAHRFARLRFWVLSAASILYTIPSLALFVLTPLVVGTGFLSPLNVAIALTFYAVALLVRSVVDGLSAVPEEVALAATALGYRRVRRLVEVDLPIAVPVILAGTRVAAVSSVSLVSVGAVIGVGGLGELFTSGLQRSYAPPIVVGVVFSLLLAFAFDAVLVVVQRLLTPWVRAGEQR
jgi:osmoprotectant transport system permease protein